MMQAAQLASGIAAMGLNIAEQQQMQLLAYMALLQKWNKVYNLTAVANDEMLVLHLLDSLSVLPYIHTHNLLDVGSGGGLPGIVLAIVKPELQVTTLDTVQKKAIFMRQAKAELGLSNLQVVHGRVEAFAPAEKFAAIISRAFADTAEFVRLSTHLLLEGGQWLAMKGKVPHDELARLPVGFKQEIIPLSVAGLNAERHLIVLEK